MKFRFFSKLGIIILSIFINLHSIQVSSVNPRSNKTIQTENLQAELDFEDDVNNESEQISSPNDYEDITDITKEHISSQNDEKRSDTSSLNSRKHGGGIVKRSTDLELAEFELEKVEKNVENEIINLKKRYNNKEINYKRGINGKHEISSSPKLMKIRVETYEIGNEPIADHSNSYKRKDRSSLSVKRRSLGDIEHNKSSKMAEHSTEETPSRETSNEEGNKNDIIIENAIQKKIDAIKNKVKRLIAKEQKHNNIRRNNAKYDKLRSSINKRSASINKRRKIRKSIIKNAFNHHDTKKLKKSIRKPARTLITAKNVSSDDLDPQLQLILFKSKGSGTRMTRRLRKPPNDSKQFHRASRRLRKPPDNSKKLHRFSRRLRKPPGVKSTLSKKVQLNKKSRHVMNTQNITTNFNFLFHEKPNRKESVMRSDHVKKFSSPKRKLERTLKHKHERRKTNHQTNNDQLWQRKERAVNTAFDQTNFNSMAGSNSLDNMVNSHDINSQVASEYSDTFGGFQSDSDDTSLVRYKRVKRA